MIKRTIEISSGPTRLYIRNRQLVIGREGRDPATVPAEDIGLLLVDHPAVSYTQAVFNLLAELGAAVVICGETHMPSSMLMPIASNTIQTERYGAQIAAGVPLKKQLWQQSVSAKIENQAAVLKTVTGGDSGLREMARRVQSGDKGNLEAQAAQRYWPALFGKFFRRDREGEPPNNLLNYGYMVTRAAVARAICAAGLLPTLGIHHRNRYNAFCLADDLMEPYRPFVDWKVAEIARGDVAPRTLGREEKAQLLGLFNHSVRIGGKSTPLLLAVHATASSLAKSFTERQAQLLFPEGLPFATEEPEDAEGGADVPAIA
ncbi:MAG: type II CRISPR-associated endonuclease Cas1 [Candidatus Binataceae bacterium]